MKLRKITQNKVRYVHLRDVAVNYGLTFAYTKNKSNKISGATIYDKTRKVTFSSAYRDGTVNGVQVYFLYPMLLKNNEPYISEVDFLTCLDPLLRYKTPVKLGMKTIMVDAGHGGSDPGAINGSHKEKVYTLQIAKRLQTQLEKLGFRVIMTRTGD
ncbi:MAG: N-acetylmuramoyl-L-alanine amidase, partial [Lentisphaeria bacterium]|nr:N-acetylmuramoyl-L-alanine amidase [Lentisphaeria bacterium]